MLYIQFKSGWFLLKTSSEDMLSWFLKITGENKKNIFFCGRHWKLNKSKTVSSVLLYVKCGGDKIKLSDKTTMISDLTRAMPVNSVCRLAFHTVSNLCCHRNVYIYIYIHEKERFISSACNSRLFSKSVKSPPNNTALSWNCICTQLSYVTCTLIYNCYYQGVLKSSRLDQEVFKLNK